MPLGSMRRVGRGGTGQCANEAGAWAIHIVLILLAKVLIDAIPGMTQDVSWTIVNLGYMAVGCRGAARRGRRWTTRLTTGVVPHVSSCHRRAVRVDVSGVGRCSD